MKQVIKITYENTPEHMSIESEYLEYNKDDDYLVLQTKDLKKPSFILVPKSEVKAKLTASLNID